MATATAGYAMSPVKVSRLLNDRSPGHLAHVPVRIRLSPTPAISGHIRATEAKASLFLPQRLLNNLPAVIGEPFVSPIVAECQAAMVEA